MRPLSVRCDIVPVETIYTLLTAERPALAIFCQYWPLDREQVSTDVQWLLSLVEQLERIDRERVGVVGGVDRTIDSRDEPDGVGERLGVLVDDVPERTGMPVR